MNYRDNVFYNLKTLTLSTNLDVNVIRDDFTMEEKKNPFFDPKIVTQDNVIGHPYRHWNGWPNIVITDKRSWTQYSFDLSDQVARYYTSLP